MMTTIETAELRPNPALKKFWKVKKRNRILYGGRASSKSWDAAIRAVMIAHNATVRILCARQFQNKIDESVYTLLKSTISNLGLSDQFIITNNKITHRYTNSEFIFYGIWRHITQIKSTEDIDILWIEEAHDLTQEQWEILEPTVRKEDSEIWIIFNPNLVTDFIYQRFVVNTPPDTIKRKINYNENPHLSNTILKVINAKKDEDEEEYKHVYLGEPRNDDDSVIIKRKWLIAAIDAHKKLGFEACGPKIIGFDVADDGGDKCVNLLAHGNVATNMDEWKADEDELMKSCRRTYSNAVQWGAMVRYDATGVGAMAGSKFNELNEDPENDHEIIHAKFQAGAGVIKPDSEYSDSVTNKDMFSNLKAQSWWYVADRLRDTWSAVNKKGNYDESDLISISSEIDDVENLINELCTPKKDYDKANKVKVESKKDLEERDIPSPDRADAFIMAFAPDDSEKGLLDVLLGI